MLGDVIGVEARAVERLDHLQPLLVVFAQRQVVAIEVIENSELEFHPTPPRSTRALIAVLVCRRVFCIRPGGAGQHSRARELPVRSALSGRKTWLATAKTNQ